MGQNLANKILTKIDLYIVSLVERADRRSECLLELERVGFTEHNFKFFDAFRDSALPIRGCALSHAQALVEYLRNSEKDFVFILEDDFQITEPERFFELLGIIIDTSFSWKTVLLAHNQAIPIAASPTRSLQRVINSQTLAGYIVSRSFVPRLIETFLNSAEQLSLVQSLPEPNKSIAQHLYAPDIYWKSLQLDHSFLGVFPRLIVQRPSFSDIQNKFVDYKV